MFARIDVDKSNTITKEEVWLWAQWGLQSMAWGLLQDVAGMIVMGYNIIGENKICSEQYDDGCPKLILTFSTDWKAGAHLKKLRRLLAKLLGWAASGVIRSSHCCKNNMFDCLSGVVLPSLLGIFLIHRKMHQPTRTIRWDRSFSNGSSKVDLLKFWNRSQHLPDVLPTGCVFDWVTYIYICVYVRIFHTIYNIL